MSSPSDPSTPPAAVPGGFPPTDTPAFKAGLIAVLLLLMLIPMYFISGVNQDRTKHQEDALSEYRKSWGPAESVLGPILVVPYYTAATGEKPLYRQIAPEHLKVAADLVPEMRSRGLFRVAVYQAKVAMSGDFRVPPDLFPGGPGTYIRWQDSVIILGANDLRAMRPDAVLNWNGRDLALDNARSLSGGGAACSSFVLAVARPMISKPSTDAIPFAVTLDLKGTAAFRIVPVARQVDATIRMPHTPVTFSGIALPNFTRDNRGMIADWSLANNAASGWQGSWSAPSPSCNDGSGAANNPDRQITVEFVEALPIYRMAERASKYGILFLTLSFLTYFLFETISRVRIHLVQYGLLGLSITLFGLLLISLGEPLGFTPAYMLSSLMILAQASLFTWSVTRRAGLAAIFVGVMAVLFGFLYVVLSLETYSLLVGSVALFAALSVVMAVTRHIDWSGPGSASMPPAPPMAPAPSDSPGAKREAGRGWLS